MLYSFLQIIKKIFRFFGLEISFYNPGGSYTKQLIKSLEVNKIDLIVDIGANKGQFATEIINAGYKGKIISIEPLSEAYTYLINRARKNKQWIVLPRMAVGNKRQNTFINISKNSVSSSLLDMLPIHTESAPESKYINKELVKVETLDSLYDIFKPYNKMLIKIDAQGYEHYILEGAKRLLSSKKVTGILTEVSYQKLYKNQETFYEIYNRLVKLGFEIWAIEKGFWDKKTGRTLQADLLMFKK